MNLQYIKYALEISRTGSISKAAENLSVAQPNLSRAVKELEYQLGISIFERTRTGMTVTPEGEKLLSAGERILRDVGELETMFTNESKPRISFSVTAMPAAYLSHGFVSFCASLPESERFHLTYTEASLNGTMDVVAQGKSKLGIIRIPLHFERYYTEKLTSMELKGEVVAEYAPTIVVARGNPLSAKETVTASELRGYGEILCPESLNREGEEGDRAAALKEISAEGQAMIYELLAEDLTTFLCTSPLPTHVMSRYGLVQRVYDQGIPYRDLLITQKVYRLTPTDEAFLRAVKGALREAKG